MVSIKLFLPKNTKFWKKSKNKKDKEIRRSKKLINFAFYRGGEKRRHRRALLGWRRLAPTPVTVWLDGKKEGWKRDGHQWQKKRWGGKKLRLFLFSLYGFFDVAWESSLFSLRLDRVFLVIGDFCIFYILGLVWKLAGLYCKNKC